MIMYEHLPSLLESTQSYEVSSSISSADILTCAESSIKLIQGRAKSLIWDLIFAYSCSGYNFFGNISLLLVSIVWIVNI